MTELKSLASKVMAWGNPWHGRFTSAGLQLENGAVQAANVTANAPDTCLVRFDGIAPTQTPPELAAAGGEWLPDAVLYTSSKRYSPVSSKGIGYLGWLWRDAKGRVWRLRVAFSNQQNQLAIDEPTIVFIDVYARLFGVFGLGSMPEHKILSTSANWSNRGPGRYFVIPHLAHSPTGARSAFTIRTGPTSLTGTPVVGSLAARTALIRAARASMLLELVITGLDASDRPAASLSTVVDSAGALVRSSSSSPAGYFTAESVTNVSGDSANVGGVVTGHSIYRCETLGRSEHTNTEDKQLLCAAYQGETLVPVWHKRVVEKVSHYDAPPTTDVRFDWQYSEGASPGIQNALSGTRSAPGWSYVATTGYVETTTDSLLLGASETLRHESRKVTTGTFSCSGPAISETKEAPLDATWLDYQSLLTVTRTSIREHWVNGVLVSSGEPKVYHDALRAGWSSVEPAVLSNNVFALCPVGTQRYLEKMASQAGTVLNVSPPAAVGDYGEIACASFNPRTGEMSLVVDGVNGYI